MFRHINCAAGLAALILFHGEATAQPKDKGESGVGRRVPHFVLPDAAGKLVGSDDFKDKKLVVVAFLGTKCPIGNAYIPTLNELQKSYADKDVQIVGINSVPGDNAETIARHVKDFAVSFPVLIDGKQSVASVFGARRTPEVFVLDGRQVVRYRGRIDDRIGYDYRRDEARRHDLREALDELLADKKVSVTETEAIGCLITPLAARKKGAVTYAEHVAPILRKHCVDCHHPGTAAPFSLMNYDDAFNWSSMIREVAVQRRMPPWHADPRFGHFANERRLTSDEIDVLRAWAEDGAPRGDAKAEPPVPQIVEGWRIGKPDLVLQMPQEFKVPAQGTVSYQHFITKTDFTEDRWVQAVEVRPGNRAVVHHIIVFWRDPKKKGDTWLASTAPGADPLVFPPGLGRKIPAGAELKWQVHYTSSGKPEADRSEIGMIFCKEPPRHNVVNHGIANVLFAIPAGNAHHKVVSSVPVIKDAVLLSLAPHMHLRGKDFLYRAVYPDGRMEVLLSVPQFDFNWQHTYRLKEPIRLPKGTKIECVAHFDNSAGNPANPDPKRIVRWGNQTWDEMMIGYIDYYWDDAKK